MLTQNFKPGPAGLVGLTDTELVTVELKTLGNAKDTFDYRDLRDLSLPAHYSQDRSIISAKIKRYPLGANVHATCKTADGQATLLIGGGASLEIDCPDSYSDGNVAAAILIGKDIEAPGSMQQHLDYAPLAGTEVERSADVRLKTQACRGCGREVPMSAVGGDALIAGSPRPLNYGDA